jgi:hypothetical protein
MSADDLNNVKCETSTSSRGKGSNFIEKKKNELETNSRDKTIQAYTKTNEFKKGEQPRTYLHGINDVRQTDIHTTDLHGMNDVRQTDIHTTEPLVPGPTSFEVETATGRLKKHKSPDT